MRRQHIAAISSFALCLLLLLLALPANAGTGPTVFINEIHYDNASTDAGEAIEPVWPAPTSPAGVSCSIMAPVALSMPPSLSVDCCQI
jgi:hypothetical protein